MIGVPFPRLDRVRIGLIGVGGRGQSLLSNLLAIDGVELKAICDIVPARLQESQVMIARANHPKAAEYGANDTDYRHLVTRDDIDLVLIATPWNWHVPMAVDAMNAGKHVGTEVPAAYTLEDCWKLVDTSEKTRRHCMILENCCYGYNELMLLNMVRKGLLGRVTHGAGAYLHDLRSLLLADEGEGLWRRIPHMQRDANLYPTHGLGPVCNYMGVNRGDRIVTQVSLHSREASLTEYRDRTLKADDPKRKEKYVTGDMSTSILKTEKGRTILVQHDVVNPRPYSRINMVQGTMGVFEDYPARIYIEGRSKDDAWEELTAYKEYEHPLWTQVGDLARKLGGHGGMDFIMLYRIVQCFKDGTGPDIDVYDAAAWSAPGPLSEVSNREHGSGQAFPDFTRGKWNTRNGVSGI